ncbi:tRNA (guanine-N(1)-)-methyltransferase [Arenicella chitinivorans]|uniref:tRNA (guanine-N(1)-)-methyltransferase n=1 Tax=Arenicella chitinivorans TaxID=1329800 RepID=A0A918RPA3_9GAMM|nr:tRNA (guanosine(37)-N1)-methyltransferase TrmD [Arenicella chitinivorans]GHA07713.1 tRNA (guanine-N(1)-)-methyltransferase [Arenicella chitinivorans]
MDCHVISIFPEMFSVLTEQGVIGRAIQQRVLSLTVHNPRDYADDRHRTVDDRPYGGGPGMVMKPEPMCRVLDAAKHAARPGAKVIYLSPQGRRFDHQAATEFAQTDSLIFLAGRYEGVDERVLALYVDEEWSIGDFVLSGGELPAMVMIDAIARLLPDSLGNAESAVQDSFVNGLLDCPHYTKPRLFEPEHGSDSAMSVPDVLLSGDHQAIERWRMQQALGRTWLRRPELLEELELTDEQHRLLDEFKRNLDDTSFEQ